MEEKNLAIFREKIALNKLDYAQKFRNTPYISVIYFCTCGNIIEQYERVLSVQSGCINEYLACDVSVAYTPLPDRDIRLWE